MTRSCLETASSFRLLCKLLYFVLSIPFCVCHAEIPNLFRERSFNASTIAEAVNYFAALGEDAANIELNKIASEEDLPRVWTSRGFSRSERVSWICRILFRPKGTAPLRRPWFGALQLPFETMPVSKWPLYPVAASGKSYFVLSEGYAVAGLPEDPKHYIAYCRTTGVFRKHPVTVPTRAQAQKDAIALRQSPAWRAIKWKDSGQGFSYAMSEEKTWKFVRAQADSIK